MLLPFLIITIFLIKVIVMAHYDKYKLRYTKSLCTLGNRFATYLKDLIRLPQGEVW